MISQLAGDCLGLIRGLEVCFEHRRPAEMTLEEWKDAVGQIAYAVMKYDEEGSTCILSLMKQGLTEQWDYYVGEQAVVNMGLTTLAHLEGGY